MKNESWLHLQTPYFFIQKMVETRINYPELTQTPQIRWPNFFKDRKINKYLDGDKTIDVRKQQHLEKNNNGFEEDDL